MAAVYQGNPQTQLIESCVAYIRFYIANPNFRAVLMFSDKKLPLAERVEKLAPPRQSYDLLRHSGGRSARHRLAFPGPERQPRLFPADVGNPRAGNMLRNNPP